MCLYALIFALHNVTAQGTRHLVAGTLQPIVVLLDLLGFFASIGLDNSKEGRLIGHRNIHQGACAARGKCKAQIRPREVK